MEKACINCAHSQAPDFEYPCSDCRFATGDDSDPLRWRRARSGQSMDEVKWAIVDHAVRWSTNVLAEVLNNYGQMLPAEKRESLKAAVTALGEYAAPGGRR